MAGGYDGAFGSRALGRRRRWWRFIITAVLAGWLVLSWSTVVGAHSGEQSYVYLDIYESTIEGRVEYPVGDLNDVLGLDIPTDGTGTLAAAQANVSAIHAYSDEHLGLASTGGAEWPIVFGELGTIAAGAGTYVVVNFDVDSTFAPVPRQFVVSYDGIIHEKPQRDALLIIGTDWGSGTFNNEASELLRYSADSTVQTVDLGDESFWRGLTGVIGLGVEHIRIGTDHILFIFALVLPAVLVFNKLRGWEPSARFGSSLWRVLKIVTMFTIAHTITLTLGGLGVIELPSALVETFIAVSIILAALHNIRPVFVNREWIIAFGFGLFHGFGFAGLLSELGLTQSRQFVSLLGFNLGIEVGQAIIIMIIFPALYLARRTRAYLPAMYAGSVALIIVATLWALERTFGIETRVDSVVDRAVLWPRSLWFLALVYVGAIGLYLYDRRSSRLLPVAVDHDLAPEGSLSAAET